MPPRHVPEDALVDDAPGGATEAFVAELEKRLTAQVEALEKRLAGQFEAATAALLARLAPPTNPPPPEGTQPANPAGTPAPEGGEQGAREPLPAELDAPDDELEYVGFAYYGRVIPPGLERPPRDVDEPRLWTLTDDTARALAEKRSQAAYDEYLHLGCYAFFSSCANEAIRGAMDSLSTESATPASKAAALAELRACYHTHLATEEATPFDDKTLEISLSAAGKARAAAAFAKATPDKPAPTESAERRKQREQAAAARKAAATATTSDKAKAKAIGAWERGHCNKWVSRIFLVPKPGTNKWRLIIDLRELNKWCKTFTMSCETLMHLRHLAHAGDWFVSMDLADGYYALGIREKDRDFFTVFLELPRGAVATGVPTDGLDRLVLASFAGKAQFLYLAVTPARFFLRELHCVLATRQGWGGRVKTTNQLRRDMEWWTQVPAQHNGRSMYKPVETAYLHADSSSYGWKAVLNNDNAYRARGFWYEDDRSHHITWKEL
eukprot:jgi/Tetstr1/463467/TSEL_008359.t1